MRARRRARAGSASSRPLHPRFECRCEDQREHEGDRDDRQAAEQPDQYHDDRGDEEHLRTARSGAPEPVAPEPRKGCPGELAGAGPEVSGFA